MVAIIRSPNAGRQDALGRLAYPPIRLSRVGLATGSGAATTNRTLLQAAINQAIAYRTWIVDDLLTTNTFDFSSAGNNALHPFGGRNYCVSFGDGTTGFKFLGSSRTTFRVGSDQITGNTTHCDFFVGRNLVDVEIRGRFDGGSLQQPNWTGGYGQDYSTGFSISATSADRGIDNLIFRNCFFQNFIGNPLSVGITANGRRTSGSIELYNCRSYRHGEGFQTQNNRLTRFVDCEVDNSAATMVGDFYEGIRCDRVEMLRCSYYSAQSALLGSALDAGGTPEILVRDCVFQGGNDGIAMQATEGTCRYALVENTVFDNLQYAVSSCANKAHIKFKDCTFNNCGTASTPVILVGATNVGGVVEAGSVVEVDGGHFDGCYNILVQQLGHLKMINRPVLTNSLGDAAITISRVGSYVPSVDIDAVVKDPVGFGVLISGQGGAFSPKGRIRGVFHGATAGAAAGVRRRNFSVASGGTFDEIEIDVTMPEAVQSFLNTFEFVGAKVASAPDYDPGTYPPDPELRVGSKGQRIIFRGVTGTTQTFTNHAKWQLTTASFALDAKSSIEMEYLGGGVWREVQRWVMA